MVSTSKSNPSLLSITAIHTLGMPNGSGILLVDGVELHVTYLSDDCRISVWASEPSDSRCNVA